MILLRQKLYSKNLAAKLIIGSALIGGSLGRNTGKRIGEARGKEHYLNNFNSDEEEKSLNEYIKEEQKRLEKAKKGELEDEDFDYLNFMNSPKEIKENISYTKKRIKDLKSDPQGYAKKKSEQPWNPDVKKSIKRHRRLGTEIGLGAGTAIGTGLILCKKLIKK